MDIISHGLWGGVGFGRKSKQTFWLAFFFGVMPDLFSFGIFFIQRIFTEGFSFAHSGPPDLASIPAYVSTLYNFTHSLIFFGLIFGLVWLFRKQPLTAMYAWFFHIFLDTFTHSTAFFPTPLLWPISDAHVDGISWGHPYIFFTNLGFLVLIYGVWFFKHRTTKG